MAAGAKLSWVIPPANVILYRRDRPSRGERENPIRGRISELVTMGEATSVTARLGSSQDVSVTTSIPTHVGNRNALAPGVEIGASLLREGIHLTPAEDNSSSSP